MRTTQHIDFERLQLLGLLFDGYIRFRSIYQCYTDRNEFPRCRVVEELCSDIYRPLKDLGHSVLRRFPTTEEESEIHDHELLCDLVIGASFHEMLQLQENLYLVKLYRPRYEDLKHQMKDESLEEYFHIGEKLIQEAVAQIPKNLKWIWDLMVEAIALVKRLLKGYRGNRVILRYLTREISLLEQVYEEKDLEELFAGMFEGGLKEALWVGAQDYYEGSHYRQSLDCLSRLLMEFEKGNGASGIHYDGPIGLLEKINI
ncbi:MAG: hypothetical protein KC964_25430, partial [Candidatus Omnitrophica bacterium]|nr:hypothetical protein [Candidatus Omnitrophota bacterium]